jgi:ABC-2 type transport system permease protein
VYATVAKLSFRRQSTYRGAMLASLLTNVVFGYIIASLARAVVAQRGSIDGWNAKDLVTFSFATQAMLGAVAAFGERELGQRVVSGDIATDMVRPASLEGWTIAQFFGKSAAQIAVRMVPTFLAGFVAFHLRLPGIGTACAAAVSLLLAIGVAATWWLVVNLTAFWIVNPRGTVQLANVLGYSLSGIAFPLVFLPARAEALVRWLPWAAQIQFPVEVFVGKRNSVALLVATYGRQILWIVVLLAVGHVLVVRGRRKLVVQGG